MTRRTLSRQIPENLGILEKEIEDEEEFSFQVFEKKYNEGETSEAEKRKKETENKMYLIRGMLFETGSLVNFKKVTHPKRCMIHIFPCLFCSRHKSLIKTKIRYLSMKELQ